MAIMSLSVPTHDDEWDGNEVQEPSNNDQCESRSIFRIKIVVFESMVCYPPTYYHEEEGDGREECRQELERRLGQYRSSDAGV